MKNPNNREMWLWVVIGVLLFLLIRCNMKIDDLKYELNAMDREWSRELIYNYDSLVMRTESLIEEKLAQEASLISDINYEIGELNVASGKVPMFLSVLLKTYSEDKTVTMSIWGEEVILQKQGERFEATILLDLFHTEDDRLLLKIIEGEERSFEYLTQIDIANLWKNYIPSLRASSNRASIGFPENGTPTARVNGYFDVISSSPNVKFISFLIQTTVNDEIVATLDITKDVLSSDKYQNEKSYDFSYESEIQATMEDTIVISIIAVDSLGFRHEFDVHDYGVDHTGASGIDRYRNERIYDPQGYLRHGGKYVGWHD